MMKRIVKLDQEGSLIARFNFFLAAIFVLTAISWPFIQDKIDAWFYRPEAREYFRLIEKLETQYSLKNNRYLSFDTHNNAKQLKELGLNLKDAKYYDFSVLEIDRETFHIIAQLKPKIIKWWFLNGPKTKLELVYEKKAGEEGRIIN